MNINRHNYEEYFILYMDNELSSSERCMVEDFAEKNPDLKEELDVLLQSRLAPNQNIVFTGKNELYRSSESSIVTPENYEELLLLYIDEELTSEQKSEVEKIIATSPQAKQELAILQKTKLQSETIIFPGKEILYRRAEKVRVVSIRWWRIAAAAVILLAIGLTAIVLINNNKSGSIEPGNGLVITNDDQSTKNPVIKPEQNINLKIQPESSDKKDENKSNTILQPEKNITKTNYNKIKNELTVENQNVIANNIQKESNNLPVPEYERQDNMDAVTNVIKNEKTLTPQNKPQFAVTTDINNRIIQELPDEPDEGKNKLRGFFRKATRFVERTTNISATDDDERLLIGGFAVKLK